MVHALDDSNESTFVPENGFTPGFATKMLPLVRRIVNDMLRLTKAIDFQREQLRGIDALSQTTDHDAYRDELKDVRASLSQDEVELKKCFDELAALGVRPHHPFDGGVDFPAMLNRKPVFLCWMPDDEHVSHWHEPGDPPVDRKPTEPHQFGIETLN